MYIFTSNLKYYKSLLNFTKPPVPLVLHRDCCLDSYRLLSGYAVKTDKSKMDVSANVRILIGFRAFEADIPGHRVNSVQPGKGVSGCFKCK